MKKVDINCDLGESFGAYTIGMDRKVVPLITSANIACGWHAGDPKVMDETVKIAKENAMSVGAHPGYPDLLGFGRRNMSISTADAAVYLKYQMGALYAFTKSHQIELVHVKPHGALYNTAGKDRKLAEALCRSIKEFDSQLILLGLAGSAMLDAAEEVGLRFASEVFADRAYEDDGFLVPRTKEGAIITDSDVAITRIIEMIKTGYTSSIHGKKIPVRCDSICVHGDNPYALEFVYAIRTRLILEDIQPAPITEII